MNSGGGSAGHILSSERAAIVFRRATPRSSRHSTNRRLRFSRNRQYIIALIKMTTPCQKTLSSDPNSDSVPMCYLDISHADWVASQGDAWASVLANLPCWVPLAAVAEATGPGGRAAVETLAATHGRNFVWAPALGSVQDPLPAERVVAMPLLLLPPSDEAAIEVGGWAFGGVEHYVSAMKAKGSSDEVAARKAMAPGRLRSSEVPWEFEATCYHPTLARVPRAGYGCRSRNEAS